jgi:hypothetical protein
LCGREHDGPQLMHMSLGGHATSPSVRWGMTKRPMATLKELLEPFAIAIAAKVQALTDLEAGLTHSQRARLLESIGDDIKKCSNFITPEASEAALELARGLGVDLHSANWHDQHRFDPGRKQFHFEHVVPVGVLRERCKACSTPEDIGAVLANEIRLAWILKEEDAALTRLGYRSKRPDPEAAYRAAGIKLSRRPSVESGQPA